MNGVNTREDMTLMVIMADKAPRHLLRSTKIPPIVSYGVCDSCVQHGNVLTGWQAKAPYRQCADCLLGEHPWHQLTLMSFSDDLASRDGMFRERGFRWTGPGEDLVRSEISILVQNHLQRWGNEL